MAPASPPAEARWTLDSGTLYPTRAYTQSLCTHLAARCGDDLAITFTFPPNFDAPPTQVNMSRLEFAGGPFHALASRNFSEKLTRQVSLSDQDRPTTFAILRDFLYAKAVRLSPLPFGDLLDMSGAAHRWQLIPLFQGVLIHIATEALLESPQRLLAFVDIAQLPGVPPETLMYFWHSVGMFFDSFRSPTDIHGHTENDKEPRIDDTQLNNDSSASGLLSRSMQRYAGSKTDHNEDEQDREDESNMDSNDINVDSELKESEKNLPPIERRFCPGFPQLWPLALSHGMVRIALRSIVVHWDNCAQDLLEVVLKYLEPRIKDDGEVCALLTLLNLDSLCLGYLLGSKKTDVECTARAMRLLAKTMLAPAVPRHEMRYAWKLCLADKQEFVKDVFFSPDKCCGTMRNANDVAETMLSMEGGSRKRSRLSKFELTCQTSVRFTLSVGCDPEDEAGIHLCWRPGVVFVYEEEKLVVDLEVLDNGCQCIAGDQAPYNGKGGCLVRDHANEIVDESGLLSLRIGRDVLASYLEVHDDDCYVTISLVARMVK